MMTLFKNQIFANLNGHAIIGVKIFFVTVGKIGAKTLQAWNPLFDLSHPSVRSRVSRCLSDKQNESKRGLKRTWLWEGQKIKRESGIWRYNDYSESFSVLITQSSRFRNKKTKTEGFRKNDDRKEKTFENEIFWQESYLKLIRLMENFDWPKLVLR